MVLDIIFGFLTAFEAPIAVLIFAIIIMVLLNIPYKFLVNQEEVGDTKKRIKELNKKSRAAQKQGDTAQVKSIMSESMKLNSTMMKSTMKPMIIGFVIVILLLPWLHDTYGDLLVPEDGLVEINGEMIDVSQYSVPTKGVVISDGLWNFVSEGDSVKMQRVVVMLPIEVPIVGDDMGWLAWYFVISIPAMVIIRKMMGINL